jgi:PPM family protein phosphatase
MGVGQWLRMVFGGGDDAARQSTAVNGAASGSVGDFVVRVGSCSDRGRRDNNEDNLFIDAEQHVYMVADGMGGQAAGEIASQLAVDLIPLRLKKLPAAVEPAAAAAELTQSFLECNEKILERGAEDPTAQNLGTTAVVAMIRDAKMVVAHIGDSRAYRMRAHKLEALTVDHNLAQALVNAGSIPEDDLKNHRYRNVLYKYLGMKESGVEPDIRPTDIAVGDRFLLASDGVTGSISDEEIIREMTRRNDPQSCAMEVVRLAIENGSKDNATAIVIYIDAA